MFFRVAESKVDKHRNAVPLASQRHLGMNVIVERDVQRECVV